jgi:hypothetical protein
MSPSCTCSPIHPDDRTVGIDRYDMQLLPFTPAPLLSRPASASLALPAVFSGASASPPTPPPAAAASAFLGPSTTHGAAFSQQRHFPSPIPPGAPPPAAAALSSGFSFGSSQTQPAQVVSACSSAPAAAAGLWFGAAVGNKGAPAPAFASASVFGAVPGASPFARTFGSIATAAATSAFGVGGYGGHGASAPALSPSLASVGFGAASAGFGNSAAASSGPFSFGSSFPATPFGARGSSSSFISPSNGFGAIAPGLWGAAPVASSLRLVQYFPRRH